MDNRKATFLRGMAELAGSGKATDGLRGLLGADAVDKLEKLVSRERATNPPRVIVIGKAGVGKSTTINNLFSARLRTSNAVQGTSAAQLVEYGLRGGGLLHIVDMPGLGEGIDEDAVFERIYREELPKADVVLYVLEADERILREDQRIFSDVVLPALAGGRGRRLVIGLNKVDLIGPGTWDRRLNHPDEQQEKSIEGRCRDIADKLARSVPGLRAENIDYYSAELRYRLIDLQITLIKASGKAAWKLPVDTKDPFELADPDVREFVREWRANNQKG
jgi:predicted GTPase